MKKGSDFNKVKPLLFLTYTLRRIVSEDVDLILLLKMLDPIFPLNVFQFFSFLGLNVS
jgi:hypothetical protein